MESKELKKENFINLYDKAEKEPDLIRKIIMLHTLDIVFGNDRDDLNYVDVCYPCIESVLSVVYLDPIKNELKLPSSDDFKKHFANNYNYSYEDFYEIIKEAYDTCEKLNDKEIMLIISEKLEDAAAIIYSTKKISNVIDINKVKDEKQSVDTFKQTM